MTNLILHWSNRHLLHKTTPLCCMLTIWPTVICTLAIIMLPSPVTVYFHTIQEDRKMHKEVTYIHKITHLRTEMYNVAGGYDVLVCLAFYERRKRYTIVLSRMYTEIISIQPFTISSMYQIL